jgi:membrane fusion protein (multidrug efflux system)
VGSDYIVTEGVKAGERIIVEGLQKVRPGDTVTPTEQALTTEKDAPVKKE